MSTEQDMLDALIQHQVYTHRASTKVVNELNKGFTLATNTFANRLRELLDELTDSEREALTAGKYTTDTLKELREAFSEYYDYTVTAMPEAFAASAATLAAYEVGYAASLYGEALEASGEAIAKNALNKPIVGGQLADDIWRTIAEKTREKALYAVREGIQQGLTTAQIVSQIRGTRTKVDDKYIYVGGIIDQSKSQIDAAVRTLRSHVSNVAYQETFEALGAEYFRFFSTLDFRTTKECGSLDGTIWKKGDPSIRRPPLHFRCRSMLLMVDKDGKLEGKRPFVASDKPVSKIPKYKREGIIGQVDANTSFKTWFERQDEDFQKTWLGATRYKLFKDGKYSIDRFVDQSGKELTIEELRKLDQKTFKNLGL